MKFLKKLADSNSSEKLLFKIISLKFFTFMMKEILYK